MMGNFRKLVRLTFLAAGMTLSSQAATYTFKTFALPGAIQTKAYQVTNNGLICGWFAPSANPTYTLGWFGKVGGTITGFKEPNDTGHYTIAFGMNSAGLIVGEYLQQDINTYHGFLKSGATFTTFDFGGPYSTALTGVNDRGDFVGVYGSTVSPNQGFVSLGGAITPITYPGATSTWVWALNNLNQMAGYYVDSGGGQHGFFRDAAGVYSSVDYPGAVVSSANGINDSGIISGQYQDGTGAFHAFLTKSGSFQRLDVPGAASTYLGTINNKGIVAGRFQDASGNYKAFIGTPAGI